MKFLTKKQLTLEQKKTMKKRVISSIIMVFYFIFIFALAILCDNVNGWSPLNLTGKRICAFLLLFVSVPIVFIVTNEISRLFFKFKKYCYVVLLLTGCLLIYSPTLVYFLHYYKFINIQTITPYSTNLISGLQLTNIFTIVLFSNIFFTCFITFILLLINHKLNIKNWLILTLLVGISCGAIIGFYFFIFVRGWITILFLILIVVSMDSFAYFGGLLFGKRKMAPVISPKKTWEGFIIALLISIILMLLLIFGLSFIDSSQTLKNIFGVQFQTSNEFLPNNTMANKPLWWVCMFFIIVALCVISVLGDLCFSLFKRKYHIKDYGNVIPGHGGILDRIDSHAFVISSYFAFSFFLALFAKTVVFF